MTEHPTMMTVAGPAVGGDVQVGAVSKPILDAGTRQELEIGVTGATGLDLDLGLTPAGPWTPVDNTGTAARVMAAAAPATGGQLDLQPGQNRVYVRVHRHPELLVLRPVTVYVF